MPVRIIAKLDVKPPFVVKPLYFEGLRKMGSPEKMAIEYYNQGADEIIYDDIVSSLYQRDIILDLIKKTGDELFIPFAAGGGVKSVENAMDLLNNGVDKVFVNTYALKDPSLISKISSVTGAQALAVSICAKTWKTPLGESYEAYSDCGRIPSGKDAIAWAKEVEDLGAGEIFLSSVDYDGAQKGFNISLAKKIVDAVSIPVVVGSGAGKMEDVLELINQVNPAGVSISSALHYKKFSIKELKSFLKDKGVEVYL